MVRKILYLVTQPEITPITFHCDGINVDNALLHGLDILHKLPLHVLTMMDCTVERTVTFGYGNQPSCAIDDCLVPMYRMENHIYVKMSTSYQDLYTSHQLERLHESFFHSSNDRVFSLNRHAKPEEATLGTSDIRKDMAAPCDPCQ